jgi:hypothetical protein
LSNFRFEAKQSEAKFKSVFSHIFPFFTFFSLFFAFFCTFLLFFTFFRFKFFASIRFSNFCFEAKQREAKFKSIFSFFSLNFCFALIFSPNFRLFHLRFRFRFLVFRIEVNHVKSGFFFASKRNKIFASISNFASEAKVRAHPTRLAYPSGESGASLLNGAIAAFAEPTGWGWGRQHSELLTSLAPARTRL